MSDDSATQPHHRIHHQLARSVIGRLTASLDPYRLDSRRLQHVLGNQQIGGSGTMSERNHGRMFDKEDRLLSTGQHLCAQSLLKEQHRLIVRPAQPQNAHYIRRGSVPG